MKYKSRAIALTYIKHSESSIISKIFTEEKGLQTFIIKGIHTRKSKKKLSHFEPLRLINIDANYNVRRSLQYLEDITIADSFDSTENKMYKSFMAFFIAEVSAKVLQENEQNIILFNFIWETTKKLYSAQKIDLNFSLKYLLELSRFLGFYPSLSEINKPFFNLESGSFSNKGNEMRIQLDEQKSSYLKNLLTNQKVTIPQTKKTELLKELLRYYKLQHYNLDSITSHLVIETLRQ